jgi:CDP-6-deoxy-D-xylo-4-hexulose-3-dehydrase
LITDKINELVAELTKNEIECRPLICGSMNEQPFWYERFGKVELKNSLIVHKNGLYLPNNPDLPEENIIKICNIIKNVLS